MEETNSKSSPLLRSIFLPLFQETGKLSVTAFGLSPLRAFLLCSMHHNLKTYPAPLWPCEMAEPFLCCREEATHNKTILHVCEPSVYPILLLVRVLQYSCTRLQTPARGTQQHPVRRPGRWFADRHYKSTHHEISCRKFYSFYMSLQLAEIQGEWH